MVPKLKKLSYEPKTGIYVIVDSWREKKQSWLVGSFKEKFISHSIQRLLTSQQFAKLDSLRVSWSLKLWRLHHRRAQMDRYRATFEPPTWQHNKSETCRYVVSDIHKQTQKLHILQRSCTRDITSPQKLTEPICSQLPTENKRSAKQHVWLPQKRCNFFATLCNYTWHVRNWERVKTREWKTRHQYAGMENEGVSSMGSQENYSSTSGKHMWNKTVRDLDADAIQ